MERKILFFCLLQLVLLSSPAYAAHNITTILAENPDFSTFNHYLTLTHLAAEINRRRTITVCAVDNAAMNDLLSKQFPLYTVKNILSLHVFADYFGAKKLHKIAKGSTTTSSLFQATGEADGTTGYVNITDIKGGKVGFSPVDSGGDHPMAIFVKSIHELPYTISVIQISHVLTSPEAEAPTGAPTALNVTSLMAKQGCKAFSDLIVAQGAEDTFAQNVETGLTIFCPTDESIKSFMSKYNNLTSSRKTSLLRYHAIAVYNSLGMLRSSNGLLNTLASEGANKYDFTLKNDGDDVKLETKVVTATVKGTLIDADPLAVFKIDKVLLPRELFKAAPSAKLSSGGDADTDDDDLVETDEGPTNGGSRIAGGGIQSVIVCLILGILGYPFYFYF